MSFQEQVVKKIESVLSSEEYSRPLADLQRRYEEGQREAMRDMQIDNSLKNNSNDLSEKNAEGKDLEER